MYGTVVYSTRVYTVGQFDIQNYTFVSYRSQSMAMRTVHNGIIIFIIAPTLLAMYVKSYK